MRSERGITLIEVLAAISLLSIVTILAFNLISSAQNQQKQQVQASQHLYSNTYILKAITKDVRESTYVNQLANGAVELEKLNGDIITYYFDTTTNSLKRNSQFVANLQSFSIDVDGQSIQISLLNRQHETLSTKLYLRGD